MPDYSYCKKIFRNGLKNRGMEFDYMYDWVLKKNKRKCLPPTNENKKAISPIQPEGDTINCDTTSSLPMGPPLRSRGGLGKWEKNVSHARPRKAVKKHPLIATKSMSR